MADVILLDAGPLGMISHPRANAEVVAWLARLLTNGAQVLVPEIADYEVRRELLRARRHRGVLRLDELRESLGFLPITTPAMRKAAEFWAETRQRGRPTADDRSLDADVILAGQAATITARRVIIASTNPKHLSRFVPSDHWRQVS